ncbi:MAG TPA: DUF72 domain-containing protein [Lentimicrobium sp.]|nr:DUF72 domain-containing protein [Lentimicrobium sp.]
MKRQVWIGTSGWMYSHWNKTFYAEADKRDQLAFYAREFNTVEVNYSFYRIPDPVSYTKWYERTPENFRFTVKLNRYLTHLKRLIIDQESKETLKSFLQDTQGLKEKLAVILIQLRPSQGIDIQRLSTFFEAYNEVINHLEFKPSACIEFRNTTWFSNEIYQLLEKYNVALVFPSTPQFRQLVFTSDFAFLRLHGGYSYSDDDLETLKLEIENYPSKVRDVFVYFNNDMNTYAIYNARYLRSII